MTLPELNMGQLRTFVAAAEHASFIAASEAVNRSQSAVSMQIMKLEQTLGQKLFVRHTRRITLTIAGETLLPFARRMLQIENEAIAALLTQKLEGRVVLGAPDDYMSSLLTPLLERFSTMFPRVEIELICAQSTLLAPMIKKGSVDLAFVTKSDGLNGTLIRREPMTWVASAKHGVWHKSPLPVALYEVGSVARNNVLAALASGNQSVSTTFSSTSLAGILAMVDAGLAVAALANCSIPAHLKRLGVEDGFTAIAPLNIVLVRSSKSNSPPINYLADDIISSLSI